MEQSRVETKLGFSLDGSMTCLLWLRKEEKEPAVTMVTCPAYYSVSAPKVELLNKIKDLPADADEEKEQLDINEKKVNPGRVSLSVCS